VTLAYAGTTLHTTPRERYARAGRAAGCPADQLANFRRGQYVAQPKQLQFHAAARECDRPGGPTQIGQGGARGGAKSHGVVCQIVFDDCYRAPGIKWLYLRSVGASARESFEDMLGKAMPGMMQYYVRARSALELPNGSRVLLGGFRNERDIDKYIGIEYDGVAIDDAHLVSKAKYDQIRGSQRTSRTDWRPRTYITFNPGGIGHAHLKALFVQPWRTKRETDTRFFFSLPEDNAFLNPEYLEYLEGLTGWLYQAWRKGDFDIAAGQFFTTWRQDIHVMPSFVPPHDWRFWLAMDYGFTHYNVVLLLTEDNDGKVYVVDEHAERKWLVPRHAQAVDAMLERWSLSRQRIWRFVAGADVFAKTGTTGGTVADQWSQAGFKLKAANDDRINGAAEVLHRLGDLSGSVTVPPTLRIFDNCARLIECLPSLEHDPHRPEDVLKVDTDENGNGGDDCYDAARYGVMEVARSRYGRIHAYDY